MRARACVSCSVQDKHRYCPVNVSTMCCLSTLLLSKALLLQLLIRLAKTIDIRCVYGTFGREITKYTVIYSVNIRFWPTLCTCYPSQNKTRTHPFTPQPYCPSTHLLFKALLLPGAVLATLSCASHSRILFIFLQTDQRTDRRRVNSCRS